MKTDYDRSGRILNASENFVPRLAWLSSGRNLKGDLALAHWKHCHDDTLGVAA